MPYVSTTLPGRQRSAPGPLHISTSFLHHQLAPQHPIGKLLSVPHCQSSWSRLQPNTPVTRTPSAPHAFSSPVDKPLKSSLKYTRTWSNREPPTPVLPIVGGNIPTAAYKRVRFNDRDGRLESVCVFRPTGRPSALFRFHSDSDSESETSSSDDDNDGRAGPWRRQRASVVAATAAALVPLEVADVISQIPSPRTPLTCFVRLDSITPILPARYGQQPLLLRGIVHVRNIDYEKQVAARYTFDDWKTTSEVHAGYADLARRATTVSGAPNDPGNGAWDQFTFTIALMLRAPPGDPPRTLLLAVRFTVPGKGEWWDNNGGDNFRVVLSQQPSAGRGTVGHGQPALGHPGFGSGPGLSLPSMWDVSFVKNTAAEFPRKPLAGALPSMVSCQREAPIPTPVTNRHLPVA